MLFYRLRFAPDTHDSKRPTIQVYVAVKNTSQAKDIGAMIRNHWPHSTGKFTPIREGKSPAQTRLYRKLYRAISNEN